MIVLVVMVWLFVILKNFLRKFIFCLYLATVPHIATVSSAQAHTEETAENQGISAIK